MRSLLATFITSLLIGSVAYAQTSKYFIEFTDKNKSPYSLAKPLEFLSQRSVDRRVKQNISLTSRDLPVNPAYLGQIIGTGAKVWYASRWMNGALIEATTDQLQAVKNLSFVKQESKSFERIAAKTSGNSKSGRNYVPGTSHKPASPKSKLSPKDYGASYNQMQMIGADKMHEKGFTGEGMRIAILDAGFSRANQNPVLQHLFENNKILATYDFVFKEASVYEDDSHGLNVFSVMAGYLPGSLIGTAYDAEYILLKTEDTRSEYRIEEVNWLIAAEYADSAGVDVINSSLGYNSFSNPAMDYKKSDMNGKTAFSTRAADLAAATGILVVVSAGNEGDDSWGIITAPADADSVLAVGAVDDNGNYASFSSKGPTTDGRIKPDVSVQGQGTVLSSPSGYITAGNGTSFSSPLMAGMAAGFWQAHPELTNMQVIDFLKRSASQYQNPDNYLGYGIPNFEKADRLVEIEKITLGNKYKIIPNPLSNNNLTIFIDKVFWGDAATVQVVDLSGKVVSQQKIKKILPENTVSLSNVTAGVYLVKFQSSNLQFTEKVVKP
jgi:subtilisin family serine protease